MNSNVHLRRAVPIRVRAQPVTDDLLVGTAARLGVQGPDGYLRVRSLTRGRCVVWILRLVKVGAEGERLCTDVVEINRPDDLRDIACLNNLMATGANPPDYGKHRSVGSWGCRRHLG